ncbi:hypothetical protein [Methylocystis heyeri]|uniref:Uncharacterized protein n=1 Tax=Methylocystis heyeri TaxID=391905 RepID=A0A6B8KJB8_9HYPH|nr:hypothetical protein [Methylocystis heyeri]QGM46668.1 hypothetical protein H2LOC_013730 [Methylocystis heyeri]
MTKELNLIFDYSAEEKTYDVYDADTEDFLFNRPTLQEAYDEARDECERRGVTMGDYRDLRNRDPSEWNEIRR